VGLRNPNGSRYTTVDKLTKDLQKISIPAWCRTERCVKISGMGWTPIPKRLQTITTQGNRPQQIFLGFGHWRAWQVAFWEKESLTLQFTLGICQQKGMRITLDRCQKLIHRVSKNPRIHPQRSFM
jgi:hypothetical protein